MKTSKMSKYGKLTVLPRNLIPAKFNPLKVLLHIKNIKYIFTKPTCICGIIDRDPERESQ